MKKSCKKPRIYEAELESSFDLVLKEAEDLYQSEGRLKKTYGRLTRCLNEMRVSYTLIGGYALIFHGVRRFTEDIDLKSLIELKLVSGMTAMSRLQDLADVQRLIERHHLTAGFAEHLNPYVRNKFIELLP